MIVRTMLPEEIDSTVTLCKYYADEAAETMPRISEEFDINSVIRTVRTRTIHPQYAWLNMYEGGRPIGFISGSFSTAPWNEKIVMTFVDMFFILKSHRNMDNFRQLVTGFEDWAKSLNAQNIFVSDMGMNEDRTLKLYNHLGYKSATSLIKEI